MADRAAGRSAAAVPRGPRAEAGLRRRALHDRHGAEAAGRVAGRLAHFKQAITYRPQSAEAHRSLGQALGQTGTGQAAAAELAEADRLDRRTADAQASTFAVSVGVQKLKANDTAGAIAQFRDAIRLADDNPQAHYQLALALRRIGERAEAQTHFDEARRLAPYLTVPDDDRR